VGWHSQELTAQGKLSSSATIGEEAVVADPLKAPGENMHQEATNKLLGGEAHGLALVVIASAARICQARVTEHIYDSPTSKFLLIPKGRNSSSSTTARSRSSRTACSGLDEAHFA
jgi:hypothetical protein